MNVKKKKTYEYWALANGNELVIDSFCDTPILFKTRKKALDYDFVEESGPVKVLLTLV